MSGQLHTDARGCVRCQHLATLQEEWDKREAEIHQDVSWELKTLKSQRDELRRERDLVLTELARVRRAFAGTLLKTAESLDSPDCPYEEAD